MQGTIHQGYVSLCEGEAMCHGGSGWLEYDRATRQQRAIDPAKPWNVLHPGLHSSFILSWSSVAAVKRCTACQRVDHTTSQSELGLSHLDKAVQFLFGQGIASSTLSYITRLEML